MGVDLVEGTFDVIVIGSGLGGLTTAASLARKGYKVAVFENHSKVGGYASWFNRGPYLFDVALHAIGGIGKGQSVYRLLETCGAAEKITPIAKAPPYSCLYKGQTIDIPQNAQEYEWFLQDMFPEDKEGIHRLFTDLKKFRNEMRFFNDIEIPGWKKGALFVIKCKLLMQWSSKTTYEVLRNYTTNDGFIEFFTVLWSYYGLPPKQLSSLYFFIPWVGFHLEGTYYIKGGGMKLSKALTNAIEESGGKVFTNCLVEEIILKNGLAESVQTKKGLFHANWFIANSSPHQTFTQLIKESSPVLEKYGQKLTQLEIGTSLSQLYMGLKIPPLALGMTRGELVILEELDSGIDYENGRSGRYDKVNLILSNYNMKDPELNQPGLGVIVATFIDHISNWPEDRKKYKAKKQKVIDVLLNRLETDYPKLRDYIEVIELATPRTMNRYTMNPEGAVYGYAQTVQQSGLKRTGHKTPIANLSLVGAWTQPGGGFQGAMISGTTEAERVSKKLKKVVLTNK